MNKNKWIVIAGIVAILNLLMMPANTAIASVDVFGSRTNELKQVNRHVENAPAKPGHPFSFSAEKICTADGKYCIRAKGSGYFFPDRPSMTARGDYELFYYGKYGRGTWTGIQVSYASDTELYFGARTIRGPVGVILEEGDATKPDKVCLWGKVIEIANAQKAICAKHAQVKIN